MSSEISALELAELAYVSDRIASLEALESVLKARVIEFYPVGTTRVETDAGDLLVTVSASGEGASQVSVRYKGG